MVVKFLTVLSISTILLILLKVSEPSIIVGKIFYDQNNLPIVDYGVMEGKNIGKQYNPITISHHAGKYYKEYVVYNNETSKHIFPNTQALLTFQVTPAQLNHLVMTLEVGSYRFFYGS